MGGGSRLEYETCRRHWEQMGGGSRLEYETCRRLGADGSRRHEQTGVGGMQETLGADGSRRHAGDTGSRWGQRADGRRRKRVQMGTGQKVLRCNYYLSDL